MIIIVVMYRYTEGNVFGDCNNVMVNCPWTVQLKFTPPERCVNWRPILFSKIIAKLSDTLNWKLIVRHECWEFFPLLYSAVGASSAWTKYNLYLFLLLRCTLWGWKSDWSFERTFPCLKKKTHQIINNYSIHSNLLLPKLEISCNPI